MSFVSNLLRQIAWRYVKHLVRRRFPDVSSITTTALSQRLAHGSDSPILIDVRPATEYAVSHLPRAQNLTSIAAIQATEIDQNTPLVLYCSVGYRSARLAAKLQTVGYTNVLNLEGSIFEWHNQGYPLMAAGESVRKVHPYNQIWGQLLQPSPVEEVQSRQRNMVE